MSLTLLQKKMILQFSGLLSICDHIYTHTHICVYIYIYINMYILSVVRIIVCIIVFKAPFSSKIWLLTPVCSFSLDVWSLSDRFYSFLYLFRYLKYSSFKTHSYSSMTYSSQTMILTFIDWTTVPCALELAFMLWNWYLRAHLGKNDFIWGCMPWIGGFSDRWVLSWLPIPHSGGFTVSDRLFCSLLGSEYLTVGTIQEFSLLR